MYTFVFVFFVVVLHVKRKGGEYTFVKWYSMRYIQKKEKKKKKSDPLTGSTKKIVVLVEY